jgi:hypothetical protein
MFRSVRTILAVLVMSSWILGASKIPDAPQPRIRPHISGDFSREEAEVIVSALNKTQ